MADAGNSVIIITRQNSHAQENIVIIFSYINWQVLSIVNV